MDTYKQETWLCRELPLLYSQYRKALLYIADNYHLMYEDDMTNVDRRNIGALIDSGIGQWKIDSEFGSRLYWFGI